MGLKAILALEGAFFDSSDPNAVAQARVGEALRAALGCLPSLEAGLLSLEAQFSSKGDIQACNFGDLWFVPATNRAQ